MVGELDDPCGPGDHASGRLCALAGAIAQRGADVPKRQSRVPHALPAGRHPKRARVPYLARFSYHH